MSQSSDPDTFSQKIEGFLKRVEKFHAQLSAAQATLSALPQNPEAMAHTLETQLVRGKTPLDPLVKALKRLQSDYLVLQNQEMAQQYTEQELAHE